MRRSWRTRACSAGERTLLVNSTTRPGVRGFRGDRRLDFVGEAFLGGRGRSRPSRWRGEDCSLALDVSCCQRWMSSWDSCILGGVSVLVRCDDGWKKVWLACRGRGVKFCFCATVIGTGILSGVAGDDGSSSAGESATTTAGAGRGGGGRASTAGAG